MNARADVLEAARSDRALLFGTDEPPPERTALSVGSLDLVFENGRLLHLACNGVEVWHALDGVYRDPDWWTPPFVLDAFGATEAGHAWSGHYLTAPVVRVRATLAKDENAVRVSAELESDADIATARTGLCLHYATTLGGVPCEIEHVDGRVSRSTFPTLVSPWPPFMQIRAIRHRVAPGCWATATFVGDTFEFEDQRNNCDPAFKAYSRSNMAARPYRLRAHVPVRQSVELRMENPPARRARRGRERIEVSIGPDLGPMPAIGIAAMPPFEDAEHALQVLRAAFLHVALQDDQPVDWKPTAPLFRDGKTTPRIDLTLDPRDDRNVALERLRKSLGDAAIEPEAVAVFPSDHAAVEAARRHFPHAKIGGGTPHFFAQINRLDEIGDVDFLSFTTSPLVHGADDDAVMESPRSLPGMVATLHHRFGESPVRVGPSAIAMRASPLGKHQHTDGTKRIAMASDDPRTRGLFGAAWALAFIAQCAAARVEAATVMACDGPSAVFTRHGDRTQWHPVASVLAHLLPPAERFAVAVSDPAKVTALGLRRQRKSTILLANLTGETVDVRIESLAERADVGFLDLDALRATEAWDAPRAFVPRAVASGITTLTAFAVACVEFPLERAGQARR